MSEGSLSGSLSNDAGSLTFSFSNFSIGDFLEMLKMFVGVVRTDLKFSLQTKPRCLVLFPLEHQHPMFQIFPKRLGLHIQL